MAVWDRGFSSSSLEYKLLVDEEDMEEFRSEKSVKTEKVRTIDFSLLQSTGIL